MFEMFQDHTDSFVQDMATKLDTYVNAYNNGELSETEFKELVDDITDLKRIDKLSRSEVQKQDILKAMYQMIDILKTAASFI